MPLMSQLSEVEAKSLLYFPVLEHDDAPSTPLGKPLSEAKLGLVTTGGIHLRSDAPFLHQAPPDASFRVIPANTHPRDIVQSHVSIGFDHTAIYRDINVTFPMDRLRELRDRGEVGSLAESYYSFMGAQRDPSRVIEETAPEVARRMKAEGVDAVLVTPT